MGHLPTKAQHSVYDILIIGGAIMGSSVAWWLQKTLGKSAKILVVERDPSYANCSTAHTNSCIRQQFSESLNVKISQFGASFSKNLQTHMDGDPRVSDLSIQEFGYLYLAQTQTRADELRRAQKLQANLGAGTQLFTPAQLLQDYPFFNLEDIVLASLGARDEGYWDGGNLFEWFRRKAVEGGVEYIGGNVVDIQTRSGRITGVTLQSGQQIACEKLVNSAGPRAQNIAKMAGIHLPVEPRKRFTWVIKCETPLSAQLPLTVDPSGVHMRQDGVDTYMVGCAPLLDNAVDPNDFSMDHDFWQDHVWPLIATRIPQFETVKIVTQWVGHYAYNTLDQNAILGPHTEIDNLYFINGFSGHGLQQAPAMGRGLVEVMLTGAFQTLDLSPFGFERIQSQTPFGESAII